MSHYSGPVNTRRKKHELVAIAAALKIEDTGTVKQLVARIKSYLEANQVRLSTDPIFQGLFMYRPPAADETKATTTGDAKNSADKVSEDKAAESAEIPNATGYVDSLLLESILANVRIFEQCQQDIIG